MWMIKYVVKLYLAANHVVNDVYFSFLGIPIWIGNEHSQMCKIKLSSTEFSDGIYINTASVGQMVAYLSFRTTCVYSIQMVGKLVRLVIRAREQGIFCMNRWENISVKHPTIDSKTIQSYSLGIYCV